MAGPIRISILANASQARRELNGVAKETSGLGSRLGKFGKMAGAAALTGFAVAGVAAVKFGADAVKAASDAQQSLGATQTIFGKFSDTVVATSKRAATAYGLSANQYRESANLLGSLLANQGVAQDKLAGKTKQMIGIASDLSAVYGGKASDAVEALSSAYKGEFDPLERYGISLKQSMITTEATALAHKKYGKSLNDVSSAQQKALQRQATENLLLKQSAKARGQFGKQTNTLAEQQQILAAQWDNLKAKLGNALIPVLTTVFMVLNKNLIPAVSALGRFLSPVIGYVKSFFSGLGSGTGQLSSVSTFIHGQLIPAFMGILGALRGLGAAVLPIIRQVAGAILRGWGQIQPQVHQIWTSVQQIVVNVMGTIRGVISVVTKVITAIWRTFGGTILGFITKTMHNVASMLSGVFKIIAGIFKVFSSLLRGDWKGAWSGVKQILAGALQVIKALISQAMNVIKSVISLAWSAVKAVTKAAWNGLKAIVSAAISGVINLVKGIKGRVTGALSGAASWLWNAGKDIIQGLLDGIESMIGAVQDKLHKLTSLIPNWKGPKSKDKKLLTPVGRLIMQSLIKGFDDGKAGIKKALGDITDLIRKRVKSDKVEKAALRVLTKRQSALFQNARAQEIVNKSMADAQKRLADLKKTSADYVSSVRDMVTSTGNITGLDVPFTATGIISGLQHQVDKARQFAALIKQLTAQGLNTTSLDQLVQAGVEGGLATAKALAEGGKAAVAQVNSLTAQLATTGNELGESTSKAMYGAGVNAAQALVDGLNAKAAALDRAATRLANSLVSAIKKALKIHSPSRVFTDIGLQTVKGLQIGLDDTYAKTSGKVLAKSLVEGFAKPQLAAQVMTTTNARDAFASGASAPGATQTSVRVTLTAQQVSQLQRGREIALDLDAYERSGGRRRAR